MNAFNVGTLVDRCDLELERCKFYANRCARALCQHLRRYNHGCQHDIKLFINDYSCHPEKSYAKEYTSSYGDTAISRNHWNRFQWPWYAWPTLIICVISDGEAIVLSRGALGACIPLSAIGIGEPCLPAHIRRCHFTPVRPNQRGGVTTHSKRGGVGVLPTLTVCFIGKRMTMGKEYDTTRAGMEGCAVDVSCPGMLMIFGTGYTPGWPEEEVMREEERKELTMNRKNFISVSNSQLFVFFVSLADVYCWPSLSRSLCTTVAMGDEYCGNIILLLLGRRVTKAARVSNLSQSS